MSQEDKEQQLAAQPRAKGLTRVIAKWLGGGSAAILLLGVFYGFAKDVALNVVTQVQANQNAIIALKQENRLLKKDSRAFWRRMQNYHRLEAKVDLLWTKWERGTKATAPSKQERLALEELRQVLKDIRESERPLEEFRLEQRQLSEEK